jgi:mTERF domain-containing protein
MVCLWPELLLCGADTLEALFVYLRDLGCSNAHLAEVLCICPHLLGEEAGC